MCYGIQIIKIYANSKTIYTKKITAQNGVDRRKVFFLRTLLDDVRFPGYPDDALAYRGGYVQCGENIARIKDSFALEKALKEYPDIGTWIIDEASFYDERLAYVVRNDSLELFARFFLKKDNRYWKGSYLEQYTLGQAALLRASEQDFAHSRFTFLD